MARPLGIDGPRRRLAPAVVEGFPRGGFEAAGPVAVGPPRPQALAGQCPVFADERLPELLFRYRARNFPQTLTDADTSLSMSFDGAATWLTARTGNGVFVTSSATNGVTGTAVTGAWVNAGSVTDYFNIPANRVVELGTRVEI